MSFYVGVIPFCVTDLRFLQTQFLLGKKILKYDVYFSTMTHTYLERVERKIN